MPSRSNPALYRHVGAPLIRATTYPDDLEVPDAPDPAATVENAAEQRRWLSRVWRDERLRAAVEAASPVLAEQVDRSLAADHVDARRIRRLVRSLGAYLLRWKGRATPFGMFAGITHCHVDIRARVRWSGHHRIVTRVDADWLGDVIDRLEQDPALLERVEVTANNTALVRGDRLVIPGAVSPERPGELAPLEVSVRYTGPVRTATAVARTPVVCGELAGAVAAAYPGAPADAIRMLVAELVVQGFLLTSLRAPMNEPDALVHLCAQLDKTSAENIPEVSGTVAELRTIHQELSQERHISDTTRPVVDRMRAVSNGARQPLVVDTVLDADITLPQSVFQEAASAASMLVRLSPYPYGYPRWKDFHSRFRERYGPGAVVPVIDVLADSGLGLPADYLGSPRTSTAHALTDRDRALLALAQKAVLNSETEVHLTDRLIDRLSVGDPAETISPPRVEMAFQLHARSTQELDHGDFRLLVTSVPRPGSSMAGRFAGLIPASARSRLAESYTASDDPAAIAAQLSFPPRRRNSENVVRAPRLLPTTFPLAEHHAPGSDVIGLDDLAVTADARRLCLVQRSTGRRIEPRVPHALEAAVLTPPLARFLAEAPIGRCAVYQAFDWGAATSLPYLPRIRHGRTILAAARWRLTTDDLPPTTAAPSQWEHGLDAWRSRLRVPAEVLMCHVDLRLPLNLERPLDRALLRARLGRSGSVELRETPESSANDWIGRAHEVLVSFHRSAPVVPQAVVPQPTITTRVDAEQLPGTSSLVYARIDGHPARQDEILLRYLPRLVEGWDDLRLWWFGRHRDLTHPDRDQHLDLYLRLESAKEYGRALARLGPWIADLRDGGLASHLQLATYRPQMGRYGHAEAMTAAEQVFAADAAAALAQIELAASAAMSGEVVTTAGLFDFAASYAPSTLEAGQWLVDNLPHQRQVIDRSAREQAIRLTDPDSGRAALHSLPGGPDVLKAWQRRRLALHNYRAHLARQRDPAPVLRSLLHLHHVRALGVDPEREQITRHLVRAVALRHLALSRRATR